MTEEHYQDGLKLPTDKDNKPWELVSNCGGNLYRMKIDVGYLYLKSSLNDCDSSICFVPDNSFGSNDEEWARGYKQCSEDSKKWGYPTSEEIINRVDDISFNLNKMQDSMREFEKEKIVPLEEYIILTEKTFNWFRRERDLILERIEKLESTFKHIDEKNIDAVWGALNERIQKLEEHQKGLVKENREYSEHFIEEYEKHDLRLNKLEEHHARQIDENRKVSRELEIVTIGFSERVAKLESLSHKHSGGYCPTIKQENESESLGHICDNRICKDHPWYEVKQECQHEWETNLGLLLRKCKKCDYKFKIPEFVETGHPRDNVKLCAHGLPIAIKDGGLNCTACY